MSEVLIGRSGITQDGQIRINRKSDFPLTLKLMKDGSFIKWYDCDFDIRAFVEDGFTTYTAGRSEGVFNHCRIEEDGTLTLFFDNHKLPIGELQLEVIFHHPDNDYGTDRIRQEAFTIASNILLVNDNGNALSLSMPEPKVVEVEVSRKENVNVFNVLGFDGFVESTSNLETETATDNYTILFDKQNKRFVALHEGIYSSNWHIENLDRTDEIYQTQGENVQPYANKIYINKIDGIIYYWDGSNLSPLRVKAEENGVTHFTEALNEAKKNLEDLITSKNEETKGLVTTLQERINTLVDANASEAIESFNEVIKFLGGVKDNNTLNALLAKINERLNTLETTKVATEKKEKDPEVLFFKSFIDKAKTLITDTVLTEMPRIYFDRERGQFVALAPGDNVAGGTFYAKWTANPEGGWYGNDAYQTWDGGWYKFFTNKLYIATRDEIVCYATPRGIHRLLPEYVGHSMRPITMASVLLSDPDSVLELDEHTDTTIVPFNEPFNTTISLNFTHYEKPLNAKTPPPYNQLKTASVTFAYLDSSQSIELPGFDGEGYTSSNVLYPKDFALKPGHVYTLTYKYIGKDADPSIICSVESWEIKSDDFRFQK